MNARALGCGVSLVAALLFGCEKAGQDVVPTGTGGGSGAGTGGASGSGGGSGSGGTGGNDGSGGSTPGTGGSGTGGAGTGGGSGTGGAGTGGNPDAGGNPDTGGTPDGGANGCPTGVQGHCTQATYPTYPGFTLSVVEDFDAPLDLDADPIWTWGDGALDEGQVRMTKAGITFAGGHMLLTASRTNTAGGQSFSEDKNVGAYGVASGELRTKYNDFRYGRYEVRYKAPVSNGNFVSTLFTFRTPKTINWRELDIELTASSTSKVGSNIVFGNNATAYPQTANSYIEVNGPGAGFNAQTDYHTYAIEWLPTKVTWYVDGQMVRTQTGATPTIPEKSAKIMMNLWIFNNTYGFGGTNGAANVYPMVAEYDWFHFYKSDAEATYPCWDVPTCLPHADLVRAKNNPTDGVTLVPN